MSDARSDRPRQRVIDLTNGQAEARPRVGMITRFPPSTTGSASAARALATRLRRRYGIPVDVIRLMSLGEDAAQGRPVVMDLNPRWHMSARFAAKRLNRCDLALVYLDRHVPIDLTRACLADLDVPVIVALDDVPPEGTPETEALAALLERANTVVVTSETARRRLEAQGLSGARVEVIPHGSPLRPCQPRPGPRRRILTWGYLAPGMGAERVLRALSLLGDIEPPISYRLIGVSDPAWTRRQAVAYRDALTEEAKRLEVDDRFEMVPLIHAREALQAEVERSDLLAVVYDSRDRASSRILAEAVSTGRPVVATAFPGAIEMLATGAGMTCDHDDAVAMADAIRGYLTDESRYAYAAGVASAISSSLTWDEVARRFALLITAVEDVVVERVNSSS